MNFNLYDDLNDLVLHERENSLGMKPGTINSNRTSNGMNGNSSRFPAHTPLAMAYVPFQQWGEVYPEDEALKRGTLFPELDFPFMKGDSCDE